MSASYHERADEHRPKTPEEIERVAHELAARGMGDHTIAHVLRLDVNALRQLLGARA
jgi:hypothetical protein